MRMRGKVRLIWLIWLALFVLLIHGVVQGTGIITGNTEDPLIGVVGPTSKMDRCGDYFVWLFANNKEEITIYKTPDMNETDKYEEIKKIDLQTEENQLNPEEIFVSAADQLVFACEEEMMILILANYSSDYINLALTKFDSQIQLSNGGENVILKIKIEK